MLKSLFLFRHALSRKTEVTLGIFGFILFLTIWHITASSGVIRPEFLPTPFAVAQAFVRLFTERDFASDIIVSVGRVWFAFLLSVVVAVPLGLMMSTYRIVGAILEPFVDFVRYLPVPALVPLLVIWFGVGETSKIAVLWMGTFFQLILLIADDTKRVPVEYIESGHTLGASVGLGYVRSDEAIGRDVIDGSKWTIDVGGMAVPATASLGAQYDPEGLRMRG